MIILTVIIQMLHGTKWKASSQHDEEDKYMSKSNRNFSYLSFLDKPLSKPLICQIWP